MRDAGIVWIGPPAEAIAAMGSKTSARTLAVANGVPVVPGTAEPLADAKEAEKLAKKFGYPILLKAAAGGGGKGMRVVSGPKELKGALEAARREAKSAFGDDAVYLEKVVALLGTRRSRYSRHPRTVLSWVSASVRCRGVIRDDRGGAKRCRHSRS